MNRNRILINSEHNSSWLRQNAVKLSLEYTNTSQKLVRFDPEIFLHQLQSTAMRRLQFDLHFL